MVGSICHMHAMQSSHFQEQVESIYPNIIQPKIDINTEPLASNNTWYLSTTAIWKTKIRYKLRFVNGECLILSAIIVRCTVYVYLNNRTRCSKRWNIHSLDTFMIEMEWVNEDIKQQSICEFDHFMAKWNVQCTLNYMLYSFGPFRSYNFMYIVNCYGQILKLYSSFEISIKSIEWNGNTRRLELAG